MAHQPSISKINNVKHAPEAPNNLISVGYLRDLGHLATFTSSVIKFKSKSGLVFEMGQKVGCMYWMKCRGTADEEARDFVAVAGAHTLDKWHHILGHVNPWTIKTIQGKNLVKGLLINES